MISYKELIDIEKKILSGQQMSKETFIKLLSIPVESEDVDMIGNVARDMATIVAKNKGYIWAAVGVDYMPCPENCEFCSFGEKWNLIKEPYVWQDEEIINMARYFATKGAKWITLRTTEYYPLEKIMNLAKKIRFNIDSNFEIVINTGEITNEMANKLKNSGIEVVYHSLRLREGIQTGISKESRRKTLLAIKNSVLDLAFLVEPIGIEHTNEEIADIFFTAMEYNAILTGAMARVPVVGTPLGKYSALEERRLAQIIAVIRLASGRRAPNICVHPPVKLAMNWGANVCVVESGAIPRDRKNYKEPWNIFTIEKGRKLLGEAGYDLD